MCARSFYEMSDKFRPTGHWPLPQNLLLLHACCIAAVVKDGEEGPHSPNRLLCRFESTRAALDLSEGSLGTPVTGR
jgi:hypothetical protein